ncbi:MAG: lysoplasmalogenase [Saprospiraceae bacterium]|nr:lysoplasmalogenase [Saprospiraceae bacterium]
MRTSFFLFLFFIISLIHLFSEFFGWAPVVVWTKILLMPLLMLALWRGLAKNEINISVQLALLALVFSTAGDLFLLAEKTKNLEIYFYLGLGSFLLAQLSYCFSFMRSGHHPLPVIWKAIYPLYYLVFIFLLIPVLPPVLLIAVMVYGLSLTAMAWNSWRTLTGKGWWAYAGIAGAILFLISDSLLAINRFKTNIPHAGFWIMATYIGAQYLIIQGIADKSRSKLNFVH